MLHKFAIAMSLLASAVCAHAQQADDLRGKEVKITEAVSYPSANALVHALGSSGAQVKSSLEIMVVWDAEGRITDAHLSPATSDLKFDRAVRDWATRIRLKPGEAGHGYVPLELQGRVLPPADRCDVIAQGASGSPERMTLRSLNLQNLRAEDTFVLPPNAPANVRAIACARRSLVPRATDYKVIAAGLPLSIIDGERMGVLSVEQGRLRFKMMQGQMSEAETKQVGEAIDAGQQRLLELAKTAGAAT